eukprot:16916-Amphidinium_carterae.1
MVLVNGVEGIGTGWSSSVPNFNPREVIANLRRHIAGEPMEDMLPWYSGFKGNIVKMKDGRCEVTGVIEAADATNAVITELPVRKWTQDYREFLEEHIPKGEKKMKSESNKLLEDYQEFHTEKSVHFELHLSQEGSKCVENGNLLQTFKLKSTISMNNMMLFDPTGKMKKYDTVLDIMSDFADVRLQMYAERKAYLVRRLTRECDKLSEQARFVQMVVRKEIAIKRRKILDLVADLRSRKFKAFHELKGQDIAKDTVPSEEGNNEEADEERESDEDEDDGDDVAGLTGEMADESSGGASGSKPAGGRKASPTAQAQKDFEYLLGMPISTLTAEKVEELLRNRDAKISELKAVERKSIEVMWMEDLDALEK